jgi:hypothetical protein
VTDTFFGEGIITVSGRAIDYEQHAESLAALVLSCAFVPMAVSELKFLQRGDLGVDLAKS